MKTTLIIISLILFSCSESSDQKENSNAGQVLEFPKHTAFTKTIIDSLGEVSEYSQEGFFLYCKTGMNYST